MLGVLVINSSKDKRNSGNHDITVKYARKSAKYTQQRTSVFEIWYSKIFFIWKSLIQNPYKLYIGRKLINWGIQEKYLVHPKTYIEEALGRLANFRVGYIQEKIALSVFE